MNDKLFTNLLVYGFLISLTVPIYRIIKYAASADYDGKDYIESKIEIPPSPRENYINPDLTCTFKNANYKNPHKYGDGNIRYCVNVIKKDSIYEVNLWDNKRYMGPLNKTIYDGSAIKEYVLEINQLVMYVCSNSGSGVCNGQSSRVVIAIKRN